MKSFLSFKNAVMGTSIFGIAMSLWGCDIRKWFGCSNCDHKHAVHASTKTNASEDHVNKHVYKIESKTDTDGKVLVKFLEQDPVSIHYTLNSEAILTDKGFESKVMAMIGSMVPQGFSLKNLPKQQLDMLLGDVVKIRALRDSELKACLANPEFLDKLAQRFEADLNTLVLEKAMEELKNKATVSDSEVKEEYNANKNKYIKDLGGTKVIGVKFDNHDDAQAFESVLNEKSITTTDEFSAEAKFSRGQFKDFGRISKEFSRGADSAIIDAIESQSSYPSVDMVSVSEDENWVLLFVDSKDTSYFSFDESRPRIEGMLKQKALESLMNKKIDQAKSKVGVQFVDESTTYDNTAAVGNEDVAIDHDSLVVKDDADDEDEDDE